MRFSSSACTGSCATSDEQIQQGSRSASSSKEHQLGGKGEFGSKEEGTKCQEAGKGEEECKEQEEFLEDETGDKEDEDGINEMLHPRSADGAT